MVEIKFHSTLLCMYMQIPELKEDIIVPEYCYLMTHWEVGVNTEKESNMCGESDDHVKINAWFGPSGTVSPLHYDSDHNLLSQVCISIIVRCFAYIIMSNINTKTYLFQVVGRKYIRIYNKEQNPYLYPREGVFHNTSQVVHVML